MAEVDVLQQLKGRFAQPLPDFYDRRVVVWHDPEGEFEQQFDALAEAGFDDVGAADAVMPAGPGFDRAVRFVKAEDGVMFTVKRLIARDDVQNDILLYRKRSRGDIEGDWLADVELYAEHFQADFTSLLADQLGAPDAEAVRASLGRHRAFFQSKQRMRKFAQCVPTPVSDEQVELGILSVLLGAKAPEDVGVGFVVRQYLRALHAGDSSVSDELSKNGMMDALAALVKRRTGYAGEIEGRDALVNLASHIFITAASLTMPESALAGLEPRIAHNYAPFCMEIVKDWDRAAGDDVAADLFEITRLVEDTCGLRQRFGQLPLEALMGCDVFPCINEAILSQLLLSVASGANRSEEARSAIASRHDLSWHRRVASYFDLLDAAVAMEGFHKQHASGFHLAKPAEVWREYEGSWWQMDAAYRRLCVAYSACQKTGVEALEEPAREAMNWAESLYSNWYLSQVNDCWVRAAQSQWAECGYVEGVAQQRKFFWDTLPEFSDMAKCTVVIISDALRYEVGHEVWQCLDAERGAKVKLGSMQSMFPSITEFGMASLLPQRGLQLDWGTGEVLADGLPTVSTVQRQAVLEKAKPGARALRAQEYLELPSAQRKALLKEAGLVYLYHNKIDSTGEKLATEQDVFDACADTVEELCSLAKRVCSDVSAARVVITADHGFLYTRHELGECERIGKVSLPDAPAISGKRHIVAQQQDLDASWVDSESPDAALFITMGMTELQGGDFIGLAPRQSVRIKRPGGTSRYVHGGVSLQETCVPVIGFRKVGARSKEFEDNQVATLRVLSETRRITSLLCTVALVQEQPVAGKVLPCEYELVFTDASGNEVSDVVKAHADKTSPDAQARVMKASFSLRSSGQFSSKDTYYLVARERATGNIVWREAYTIDVAFAPAVDFGF